MASSDRVSRAPRRLPSRIMFDASTSPPVISAPLAAAMRAAKAANPIISAPSGSRKNMNLSPEREMRAIPSNESALYALTPTTMFHGLKYPYAEVTFPSLPDSDMR